MTYAYHGPSAAIAAHPLYSTFVSIPTVCFLGTLANDIAYWRTSNLQWQNFSEWLLFAGLVVGGFVLLAEIIAQLRASRTAPAGGWLRVLGTLVVLALAFVNSLVHARDGWTAVVFDGLILSAVTVVAMIVTGLAGTLTVRRASGAVHNG
jgi:uncharacterized membrane protein